MITQVEQLVDEQKDTIRTLKGKLKATQKELYEMQVEALDDDDEVAGEDTDHSGIDSDAVLPDPIEDPSGLYCCVECSFEVVDGECQSCFTPHNWTTVCLRLSYTCAGAHSLAENGGRICRHR